MKGPQATRIAHENANAAISSIEDHVSRVIDALPNVRIDSQAVLKAARKALDQGTFTPEEKAAGMRELQGRGLNQPATLRQADALRRRLNADNQSYLGQNTAGRSVAYQTNSGFVARDAAADALRGQTYQTLKNSGVPDIDELRKDEGALIQRRNV